ncbi:MAG: hypothetical protein V4858_17105 [Pseudomonadota bacterium]
MPNRILRDGILTSPRVAKLNWAEETFYRRLHSVVDDFGRYYADHGLVRAACYPRLLNKVSDSDIEKWLTACVTAALVRVYPAEDGERYLMVLDFKQQVRATKSKFPQPPDICAADATQSLAIEHLDVSVSVSVSEGDKPAAQAAFVLPDWIPGDVWAAYLETRKAKKAKSTVYALELVVKTLEQIRDAGHEPIEALKKSIKAGWTDVYAPKPEKGGFTSAGAVSTVPGKQERDPELTRLDIERKRAVPMPAAIREQMAKLKQGAPT